MGCMENLVDSEKYINQNDDNVLRNITIKLFINISNNNEGSGKEMNFKLVL